MRNEFVYHLKDKILKENKSKKVAVLTGDLGFSVLEPLQEILEKNFINVGVAEALMMSVAAGLADSGLKVYAYSIMPFATFRCLEQIRNDIAYHNLDVTIVGIGAGYGYGSLGPTHHATEDLAAVWSIPNIKIFSPGNLDEAQRAFDAAWESNTPSYLRLSKGGDKSTERKPEISQTIDIYNPKGDLAIVTTGLMLASCLELQKLLYEKLKIKAKVISCPFLKPFPAKELTIAIGSLPTLVVEELNPYGGFSGQVAKCILEGSVKRGPFKSVSAYDAFAKIPGDSDFQRKMAGLSIERLFDIAKNLT